MRPTFIVIHHSQTKDGVAKDWEAIRRFHVERKGWSDVGYHYGIERVGERVAVQIGRSESTPGAHCKHAGFNQKSLGLCVVGNFDLTAPDEQLIVVLRGLVETLRHLYSIPRDHVLGHREAQMHDVTLKTPTKTCPGNLFDMDAFRASLGA